MAWTAVSQRGARLHTEVFSGSLDFAHPEYGLQTIFVRPDRPLAISPFCFQFGNADESQKGGQETLHVAEAFVRDNELNVRYAGLSKRGVIPRLLWKYWNWRDGLALELRVYVQSPRLESHPSCTISVRTSEMVQSWEQDAALVLPERCDIHLAFFSTGEAPDAGWCQTKAGEHRWQRALFPRSLEKGVLEVGQVWMLAAPSESFELLVRDFRKEIERLPLPLTT